MERDYEPPALFEVDPMAARAAEHGIAGSEQQRFRVGSG